LIQKLFQKGDLVFGPFPADGFFGSQSFSNYDAVLAMYHDQGLIPFKTLSFGKGVNFTAGLNRVRTSPDHGTAFDIAGQGKADSSSFVEALFAARSIFLQRKELETT
jgi:4-hydroxythreonine-4-phosphate dehydrogenase